jgi:uncharacterized protein YhaN
VDDEIVLMENALSALARTDAAELHNRRLRQQGRALEEAREWLDRAATELERATREHEDAFVGGAYPRDVPERIARAEVWWEELEKLRRAPAPRLGIGALVLLAVGLALLVLGYPLWALATGAAGVLAGAAWLALWLWALRRRKGARTQVRELLNGIPQGKALGPGNRQRALTRYHEQRRAEARLQAARRGLSEAIREARSALAEVEDAPRPRSSKDPRATGVAVRARRLAARMDEAAARVRDRLTAGRSEIDRIGELSLALPPDVPPTEESVAKALRQRRAERSKAQETLGEVAQELMERGTPSESAEALQSQLASLEPRRAALAQKAEVLEAAHALILDAYDDFRDRDQDRLADRVSEQVHRLSDGRMDSIHVAGSLDEARVRIEGRLVPMCTPPLSFGEFHALQLGVRLGAAEFLAGMGILPPLLVDEPFAHLDSSRAEAVWRLLCDVSGTRQVIITTQDARLLESLGIDPDIRLER